MVSGENPRVKAYILLVEDDALLGESLKEYLELQGFAVVWVGEGFGNLLDNVSLEIFHCVVLDLILPGISGEEILEGIRKISTALPVLVLTAKGGLESKKLCFLRGADDYLVKPFEMDELVLRIEALLRRSYSPSIHVVENCYIDENKKIVVKEGREVRLSKRAWELLTYLLGNRGRVMDKTEILQSVWKDTHVTEESLRAYIKELRKIVPKSIETYKGRGYKII